MHSDNFTILIFPSIFGEQIQHVTYSILMKINPFKLEIPEIGKSNRSGKTLSDLFILSQSIQRETEVKLILC